MFLHRKKNNQVKKSSLSFFIIGNIVLMLMLTVLSINIESYILSKFMMNKLVASYCTTYPEATTEQALEAIEHFDYTTEMEDISLSYSSSFLIFEITSIVIITAVFVTGILRRVTKELRSFELALDNISYENVIETDIMDTNDIKEFDNICRSYNQMIQRLRESEQKRTALENERRQMIADISHDLKTPITVIQGYARALNDDIADEEAKKKYYEAIYRKTESVAELINTFHEYSKLDHPQFDFNMKEGDLCEYLRGYLAMKYEDLDLAGFELEADLPDKTIMYSFDHKQFKRVFENLITNSYKHNDPGTTIYADMTENDDIIIIHIGDNGKGIPEELRKSIFEPFVVGNKSRTGVKGSGLGLAISKRIVEAHGGTIKLIDPDDSRWKTMYRIVLPKYDKK